MPRKGAEGRTAAVEKEKQKQVQEATDHQVCMSLALSDH